MYRSAVNDYPASIVPVNHVAPVPRRIRAYLGAEKVLDTTRALYVWEWPHYPQYYIPLDDVRRDLLVSEGHTQQTGRGLAELHGLQAGETHRPRAARVIADSAIEGLKGTVRFEWGALDAWFEEDEQVFVHPRDPYSRVDALRSNRRVRVELEGVVLADSASPVMVFETGLPTRYYVNRTDVRFEHLIPSDTVTSCPYKGMTSGYWSVRAGGRRPRKQCTRTWPGPTTSRPASCCPSPAWSPSTTRWSTPTWTASYWTVRRHISPERARPGAEPQPFRSWATMASACSRVSPRLRLDMGSTRLPPARKITWSVRQARRSGCRSAIAICSRSMASCRAAMAGTTRSS